MKHIKFASGLLALGLLAIPQESAGHRYPDKVSTQQADEKARPLQDPDQEEVSIWLPGLLSLHDLYLEDETGIATPTSPPPTTPSTTESFVAYEVPAGTQGNQQHRGGMGMDFDVLEPIRVTHLGVFDSAQDGLRREIFVYIVERESLEVPAAMNVRAFDGELRAGSRMIPLEPAVRLEPGFKGSIVVEGYGPDEENGNSLGAIADWTTNSGRGAIKFVGSGRYSFHSWQPLNRGLPAILDGGPSNRYAAGTFAFERID